MLLVVAAFLILGGVQWLYDNMHVSELVSDNKHETVLWDEKVLKAKVYSCLIRQRVVFSSKLRTSKRYLLRKANFSNACQIFDFPYVSHMENKPESCAVLKIEAFVNVILQNKI